MKRLLAFVLILGTLFGTALVAARTVFAAPPQRGSSRLTGVVLGPNDKPVARAAITYQSSAGTAPHVVRTDARGRFNIPKLAADNYDLRASANGIFSEWEKKRQHSATAKRAPSPSVCSTPSGCPSPEQSPPAT
jgi:hypothetical protein